MSTPIDHAAIEGGTVINDPKVIEEVLRSRQSENATLLGQPMRYAGQPASAQESAGVTADDLKPAAANAVPQIEPRAPILPEAKQQGAPDWAIVPAGLIFPRGRVVYFLRFEASWTNTPNKGPRQVIFWAMSVGDKKLALQRSMNDPARAADEMVKSCIRAHDGKLTDLGTADMDIWWDEIGEKCRGLLTRVHGQAHFLNPVELDHFLKDCIEARTAG